MRLPRESETEEVDFLEELRIIARNQKDLLQRLIQAWKDAAKYDASRVRTNPFEATMQVIHKEEKKFVP